MLIMKSNDMQYTIHHFSCSRTLFIKALQVSYAFLNSLLCCIYSLFSQAYTLPRLLAISCYVFTIGLLDLVIIIGDQFIEPYGSSGSLPLFSRV